MSTTKPSQPAIALAAQVKAARRVSVPLIAVTTPDPAATIETVCQAVKESAPQLIWDIVQGIRGRNEPGKEAAAKVQGEFDPTVGNPAALFTKARLAAEFGVGKQAISKIARGLNWTHVVAEGEK